MQLSSRPVLETTSGFLHVTNTDYPPCSVSLAQPSIGETFVEHQQELMAWQQQWQTKIPIVFVAKALTSNGGENIQLENGPRL